MKKLVWFLQLIFLLFLNCGSRQDELSTDLYVGTWTWKSTNNGVGNIVETPQSTGIIRKLALTENYQYSITENEVVKNQGTYSLVKGTTSTDHSEKTFLVFSNNGEKIVLSIDAAKLVLGDDHVDGFTYYYEK